MSQRALLLEAHHTTHIEGTQLTIEQAKRLWAGQAVPQAQADDVRERGGVAKSTARSVTG